MILKKVLTLMLLPDKVHDGRFLNIIKAHNNLCTVSDHFKDLLYFNPRANGAKRRSGRKPEGRVTNFALAEFKVVAHGS